MEATHYIMPMLIEFFLGILGAEGSIFTIYVQVYVLERTVDVGYLLLVVGATSLASSIPQLKVSVMGWLELLSSICYIALINIVGEYNTICSMQKLLIW